MKNSFIDPRAHAHILAMDQLFVPHREFDAAYRKVGKAIESFGHRSVPLCLCLTGPSGVGKSALRKKLVQVFEANVEEVDVAEAPYPGMKAFNIPLLSVEMRPQPTIRNTLGAMLKRLGDPRHLERDRDTAEERLIHFLKATRCHAILLDEGQRLLDRHGEVVTQDLLDWFKYIAERSGVAIVLMGVGRLARLLVADGQVKRRWGEEITFAPYTWPTVDLKPVVHEDFGFTADQLVLIGVMGAFEEGTGVPIDPAVSVLNPEPVTAYRNCKRFFYASRGVVGLQKKLFLGVLENWSGEPTLTMEMFRRAFDEITIKDEPDLVNPFGPDWHGQHPPPMRDDSRLLHRKRAPRKPTLKKRRRDLGDAMTKG